MVMMMLYILISACLCPTSYGVHPDEKLLMMRYILISASVLAKAEFNK